MQQIAKNKKVAIVCDWLTGIGGAERVVLELHKMFPEAPIYTSQYDPEKIDWFKNADIRVGWLQKIPKRLKKFIPVFRAWYFSRLDLSEYDIIISNTGAEAKGVKFGPSTTHLCICNAPTHYYWSRYEQYLKEPGFGKFNWLARLGLKMLVSPMRKWDFRAAQRPTELIAISSHIQKEIKKYYKRDSAMIFPPVKLERFNKLSSKTKNGFVITGRQTPYKRVDLAVAACTKLNLPLTVVGDGPEHQELINMSGTSIKFITNATDKQVNDAISSSEAFIFPGLDDFGISPVEAMAAGLPVIAYRGGGALDYVVPGKTGEFFDNQNTDSLCRVLEDFEPQKYSSDDIKRESKRFSVENFQKSLIDKVNQVVK
ncbi:glycosyltransferase [Candidatus Saccharibacteria bacterium]|nr:glycosyltransferase [Candidatus Saccharibacteria bacterium]